MTAHAADRHTAPGGTMCTRCVTGLGNTCVCLTPCGEQTCDAITPLERRPQCLVPRCRNPRNAGDPLMCKGHRDAVPRELQIAIDTERAELRALSLKAIGVARSRKVPQP